MSEDYSYLEVSNVSANAFDVTVANSGGTSGTDGAYIPAIKASTVTGTTSLSAVVLAAPSVGNIRINNYQQFTSEQAENMTLTIPSSLSNGNGFSDKQEIMPPAIRGAQVAGSGTSGGMSPALQFNVGSNINRLEISSIDAEVQSVFNIIF